MSYTKQKAPARWKQGVAKVREVKKQQAKVEAAREEKRRRQEPIAFWMKRELTEADDATTTTIANWRMLAQMPPGVWLRTWDPFSEGVAHYTAELMGDAAHLEVSLNRPHEVWWQIKITAWTMTLAQKIGPDYPEMLRECFGESIERLEEAHDHVMHEAKRHALVAVLREGEVIVQDWIARYAQKEA